MKNYLKITYAVFLTATFLMLSSSMVSAEMFSNNITDANYDFNKLKKVFILEVDTSALDMPLGTKLSDREKIELDEASKIYVKKMKCKLVDKELADAFIKIKITTWKREYDHTVPERTVTYYEGYKEVNDPFPHRPPPPPRNRRVSHDYNPHRQPPLMIKRRVWTTSSTWFPGSKVNKRIIPAQNVYRSEVKALFEIRDTKSGQLIMSREGSLVNFYGTQLTLYKEICEEFFKSFRNIVKQAKKAEDNTTNHEELK